MIAIKFRTNRISVNLMPNCVISNIIMGIFVVDQAPIKRKTFVSETPFFKNTAATGKEAYRRPAENEPKTNVKIPPFIPASFPMYFIIVSLGTHTSISAKSKKLAGWPKAFLTGYERKEQWFHDRVLARLLKEHRLLKPKEKRSDIFW